jgi:hypothetical protein
MGNAEGWKETKGLALDRTKRKSSMKAVFHIGTKGDNYDD